MNASSILRVALCVVAPALLTASTRAATPAPLTGKMYGTCAACTSSTHCAVISGSGSTGCTFTKLGCTEDLGICVCGNCGALAPDSPENRIERDLEFGRVPLHAIGNNRFAAWNCSGELIALAERRADGSIIDLPVDPHRAEYRYQTLLARAG